MVEDTATDKTELMEEPLPKKQAIRDFRCSKIGGPTFETCNHCCHGFRFSGELEGEAVSSGEKAKLVRQYAEEHRMYLPECQAYGDSFADLEMLMQVSGG